MNLLLGMVNYKYQQTDAVKFPINSLTAVVYVGKYNRFKVTLDKPNWFFKQFRRNLFEMYDHIHLLITFGP